MKTRPAAQKAGDKGENDSTPPAGSKPAKSKQRAPKQSTIKGRVSKKIGPPAKKAFALPHGMGAALKPSSKAVSAAEDNADDKAETKAQGDVAKGETPSEDVKPARRITRSQKVVQEPIKAPDAAEAEEETQPSRRTTRAKKIVDRATLKAEEVDEGNELPADEKSVPATLRTRGAKRVVKKPAPDAETVVNDENSPEDGEPLAGTRKTARPREKDEEAKSEPEGKIEDEQSPEEIPLASTRPAPSRAPRIIPGVNTAIIKFRGVTVEGNIVQRHGSTIIPDVSQYLNPDFKMLVKRGTDNTYGLTIGHSPYPYRQVPSPEACEDVHRILVDLHGECKQPEKPPVPSLRKAGCGEVPSVLDALLRTLISGNTLMARADAAIQKLADMYGVLKTGIGAGSVDWEKVRIGSLEKAIEAVKPAGCAGVKAAHIKRILDMVFEENQERAKALEKASAEGGTPKIPGARKGTRAQKAMEVERAKQHFLSLDHVYAMTKDEAMAEFLRYPGIGVKTAACVILFCLRFPCYAVDTHVHKFNKWLGWVPERATELDTYNHGEHMVPDHLKYALHQLFIRHGQDCFKCRKSTKPGSDEWKEAPDCPLEDLLTRDKEEAKEKPTRKRKVKDKEESEQEESGDGLEDDLEEERPKAKRPRTTEVRDEEASEDDFEEDKPKPKPKRPRKRGVKNEEALEEEEKPKPKRPRKRGVKNEESEEVDPEDNSLEE